MPVLNPEALLANRVDAIRRMHTDAGITRAELDLSGGIDSAVMAGLLVIALGPENVTLAHTIINSDTTQTERAEAIGTAIGCPVAVGDFSGIYAKLVEETILSLARAGYNGDEIADRIEADPTILGSIRSTLRAPLGRGYNRLTGGGIRHGTGNECEDRFLRFYQKGGDGEVDSNPLAMLSKGEVYQLAFALSQRFPEGDAYLDTIKATPSPDLWGTGDGHSDEAELLSWTGAPFTYGRIDPDTGAITSIGTIERVARFLDMPYRGDLPKTFTHEIILFANEEPIWPDLLLSAQRSGLFPDEDGIELLLRATRRVERITRHKANPNCPTLGVRAALVAEGILTDDLTL